MRIRSFLTFLATLLLTIAIVVLSSAPAWVQTTNTLPALFKSVNPNAIRGITAPAGPTIVRQRLVNADLGLLTQTRGDVVRLNLFDDVAYSVVIERVESPPSNARGQSTIVQFGRIQGQPDSEVYLVRSNDVLSGNIRLGNDKLFQIRYVQSGIHSVQEINTAAFPPDHAPGVTERSLKPTGIGRGTTARASFEDSSRVRGRSLPNPTSVTAEDSSMAPAKPSPDPSPVLQQDDSTSRVNRGKPTQPDAQDRSTGGTTRSQQPQPSPDAQTDQQQISSPQAALDNPSEIAVLILYTAAAREEAGGTDSMIAQIRQTEVEANQGLAQSGISYRVRVANWAEVNYTETGDASVDLDRLTEKSDGFMDNIHALRQQNAADAVSLWVKQMEGCGLGWRMGAASLEFRDQAFSVVKRDCATGNFSFAHELGHNLGSCHDVLTSTTSPNPGANCKPSLGYSYGHQDPDRQFRTIMSYNCPNGGCPRVNHWSNPGIKLNNKPTGIVGKVDNFRALNQTLPVAAGWLGAAASVPTQGQCFAEQSYRVSAEFPQAWIKEKWGQGFLLTALAERDQQWAAVMSKPTGANLQSWRTESGFPQAWVKEGWGNGQAITTLGSTKSQWAAVMSKPTEFRGQRWATNLAFPQGWVQEGWGQGNVITSVGAKAGQWGVAMSGGTNMGRQRWAVNNAFPQGWVKEGWGQNSRISGLGATADQWGVVMSAGGRFGEQSWFTAGEFPKSQVRQRWDQGFYVTDLAGTGSLWGVVMSKCQ